MENQIQRFVIMQSRDNNAMHAKSGLGVFLEWMITGSGSVITDVITLGCHMGNLLDAILKHETDEIRFLVRNNPSLATARSPAGNLPLDVAKSTGNVRSYVCLLYTSPSPRDGLLSRMPSSA